MDILNHITVLRATVHSNQITKKAFHKSNSQAAD